MRVSQMYAPTLREVPAEAEVVSHQLMLPEVFTAICRWHGAY